MDASRKPWSLLTAIAVGLLAFGAAGCHGTPEPVTRAEAPPAKTAPAATPSPAEPAPSAPAASPAAAVRDDDPVVVDPGVDDAQAPKTLVESAKAEKERRANSANSDKPRTVINDKNLHTYASKGQITVIDTKGKDKKAAAASPPAGNAAKVEPGQPVRDEQYWRGRALEIRERWRQAADDVKELEQKSAELRQKFYLESDTFNRDNQIKPQWDRVLDKLRQARLDVEEAQKELAELLEEGRAADVTPGWLREGEDDEPEPAPKKKEARPAAQSIEPPVIEPPAFEPPPAVGGLR